MKQSSTPLETRLCTRCGGSGQYSYCQSYGTTCFKCLGGGYIYTKRGEAASVYLKQIRSKPVEEFAVGELIQIPGVPGFMATRFERILSITPEISRGSSLIDGQMVPYERDTFAIGTAGGILSGLSKGELYRRGLTQEEKAATLAQALAYQATLTQAGTPKKRACDLYPQHYAKA